MRARFYNRTSEICVKRQLQTSLTNFSVKTVYCSRSDAISGKHVCFISASPVSIVCSSVWCRKQNYSTVFTVVDLVFVACHGSMLWLMQLIDLVLVNKDTSVYTVVFACICCNALCIPPVSTGRYLTLLSVDVISSSTSSKKIMKSHKNVCSSGGCSIE